MTKELLEETISKGGGKENLCLFVFVSSRKTLEIQHEQQRTSGLHAVWTKLLKERRLEETDLAGAVFELLLQEV